MDTVSQQTGQGRWLRYPTSSFREDGREKVKHLQLVQGNVLNVLYSSCENSVQRCAEVQQVVP